MTSTTLAARKSLKGTWPQAIVTFVLPLLVVFSIRWMIVEPFVIPSGSMIPTLLIHDHIIVKKYALGLKLPLTDYWMVRWREPRRGEVMVFRYPENPDTFYVKRLIGLPGDTVSVTGSGHVTVNGKEWTLQPYESDDNETGFSYFNESSVPGENHIVRFYANAISMEGSKEYKIPEGYYFFMGDNRDQSSDGRVWGNVPTKYLVGPAWLIWLSCENTLSSMSYVCDPRQIRWQRLFNPVQ